jgi:AraC family transcriptional regulator
MAETEMLMIEIPDASLQDVAQMSGHDPIKIEATPCLDSPRVASLIQSMEAEVADGMPSSAMFLETIGRSLASTLLETRGILYRSLR